MKQADHLLWRSSTLNIIALVIFQVLVVSSFSQSPASKLPTGKPDQNSSIIDLSGEEPVGPLAIRIGSVVTLRSHAKITKIYVADPAILEAYVADPRTVVLNAKTPGLTSVVLWDESGKQRTLAISADLRIGSLNEALQKVFPAEEIRADVTGERIVLSGTVGTRQIADEALKLAASYSKSVVDSIAVNSARVPQVELKVRFIEIDRSRLSQFGINIFGPGGGSAVGGSSTGQFSSAVNVSNGSSGAGGTGANLSSGGSITVSNPLELLFYSSKLGVAVTIEDLESKQLAQILAEPTITTMSGHSASLLAGGEFPFPVVQSTSGGPASISLQFRPYGVKLEVTPRVNSDGTVDLKVRPEVSALDYTNAVTISGFTVPAIATKTVDTEMVLHSGQSFAISGLLDKQTVDSLSRIPGLSQLPILGALFRSKATTLSTSELMIIVTPRIIYPLETDTAAREPIMVRPMLNPSEFDPGIRQTSAAQIKR